MKKIIYFFIFSFFLSTILIASEKKIQVIDGDTIHIGKLKYRFLVLTPQKLNKFVKKIIQKFNVELLQKALLKIKLQIKFLNVS